jgi:hypothetical protein
MNHEDQFEARLRCQPSRETPAAWREEILAAAQAATPRGDSPPAARHLPWWRELFWPCPQAWAALAAVWLVMFAAHFVARESASKSLARQAVPPSPQLRELLKRQGQLFAELVGSREKSEADRPKPVAPQPRSQRREEFPTV